MPRWFVGLRNQAARWVYSYHQTSALVHPELLLGLDQWMVNPFPERMYWFGSSGWPTSNLLKRCGAPPALWRHSAQHKNTTMSEKSIHSLRQSVMWNMFDIKYSASHCGEFRRLFGCCAHIEWPVFIPCRFYCKGLWCDFTEGINFPKDPGLGLVQYSN